MLLIAELYHLVTGPYVTHSETQTTRRFNESTRGNREQPTNLMYGADLNI